MSRDENGFESTFDIHLPRHEVWAACQLASEDSEERRIPGFPSFAPGDDVGRIGCRVRVLESDPQHLLRGRKEDMPCMGTEVGIRIEPANASGWPTRVTLAQTGFGDELHREPDAFQTHWRQIVADFRLYVEHGIHAPGTKWGVMLGATTQETPIGLEVTAVTDGTLAHRAGMRAGDLLLVLNGIRLHDTQQLWTVLAHIEPATPVDLSWVRERALMEATVTAQ